MGREAAWWVRVEAVRAADGADCWDLEVENEPHNYIAGGLVSHNSYGFNKSHATAYGIIAYWGMWLKRYYPLEFYWGLLKNEPDRIHIQRFAKDAKQKGIELLPPHVSRSGAAFAIDGDSIRGSLQDIKGCGDAAAQSIMDNQPYEDLWDFVKKVNRRKVNKGVVAALAKAGALDDYIPNVKWFVENLDELWKLVLKGSQKALDEAREMLEGSREAPDYPKEERQLVASKVNPLAFGRHPIDAYEDFIGENIRVPLESMSDEDFFERRDGKGTYIVGVIVEVKYNQVGDFHTGELPSEAERERQFWGRRYANVNIEDAGGVQNRVKFDWDIFDDFREIIDAGVGTPVIAHTTPNAKFENLRAHFAVNVEGLRKKIVDREDKPNVWERIVTGRHPVDRYPWADKKVKIKRKSGEIASVSLAADAHKNLRFRKGKTDVVTGIVTHVRPKYDRSNRLMAFIGLLGGDGYYVDVLVFASQWAPIRKQIRSGQLVQMSVDVKPDRYRGKGAKSYIFNGNKVKLLKKSTLKAAAKK